MSMNIYAKRGHLVIVSKVSAHNGYDSQKEDVEEHLEIGKLYTIDRTDVGGSSTRIYLKEFPDKSWNSVNFIDYIAKPDGKDFMEPNPKKELPIKDVVNHDALSFAMRKWKRDNEEQIEARAMYKEGVTKLSDTEMIVDTIRVYDKSVNGCLRHEKHVMVSYQKEGSDIIYDLFLDENKAGNLHKELTKALYEKKY